MSGRRAGLVERARQLVGGTIRAVAAEAGRRSPVATARVSGSTPVKKAAASVAPVKAARGQAPVKKAAAAKKASVSTPRKTTAAKKASVSTPSKTTAAKKAAASPAPAKAARGQAPAKKAPAVKAPAVKAPAKAPAAQRDGAASKPAPARTTAVSSQPASRAAGLAVRDDESPWTTGELAQVRAELELELTRLRAEIADAEEEIADLLRDAGDGAGDDQADAGTKTFEREHEMSLAANSRDMLDQTERALARIDAGTYGVCEFCGNPIGKRRLQAFPRATLCMSCKQREERR